MKRSAMLSNDSPIVNVLQPNGSFSVALNKTIVRSLRLCGTPAIAALGRSFSENSLLEIPMSERCAAVKRCIERSSAILFEIKGYKKVKEWEVSNEENSTR
jgi:hypothetical protein